MSSQVSTGADKTRILLIRPSALGDVARTVPALVTLRQAYPDAQIDWLVHENYADVVRFHPMLTGVVSFPRQAFAALWHTRARTHFVQWLRDLRLRRYDLVIDLQGLFRSGLFTWATHAPHRLGFANAREFGWLAYNRKYRVDRGMHTVDRMLTVLERDDYQISHDMRLYTGPQGKMWVDEQLAAAGNTTGRYFCVAPTASWLCKCWPVDRFAKVAARLLETGRAGEHVVILAAPHEQEFVAAIQQALPANRVLAPRTTVAQMMALLERATLVLANDSGPLHVAVGFDRPLVCIFGPTDPAVVGPYRRLDSVVAPAGVTPTMIRYFRKHRHDVSLISKVSVEEVWARVEQALQK